MGVIITPPTQAIPVITYDNNTYSLLIDPVNTNIASNNINLNGTNSTNLNGTDLNINNDNVLFNGNSFSVFNGNDINLSNASINIGDAVGSLGFYNTQPITQPQAIANPTPLTIYDRVGDILDVLRLYGLIKT